MTCQFQSPRDATGFTYSINRYGGRNVEASKLPSTTQMAKTLDESLLKFANSGFTVTDSETFNARIETCKGCEFWEESVFANTGRCKECGCSTQAKLRMATEKCPVGKWRRYDKTA